MTGYCTKLTYSIVTVSFIKRGEILEAFETYFWDVWVTVALKNSGCLLKDTYMCGGPQTLFRSRATWWSLLPRLVLTFMVLHYQLHHMRRHIRQYNERRTNLFLFFLLCPYRSCEPPVPLLLMAARDGAGLSSLHQPVPLFLCEESACAEVQNDIWLPNRLARR